MYPETYNAFAQKFRINLRRFFLLSFLFSVSVSEIIKRKVFIVLFFLSVSLLVFDVSHCYSQQPTLEWARLYDGPEHLLEFAGGMVVDSLGNIYVVGSTQHSGAENQNFVTLKYSPAGNLIWSKEYNGPGGNSIDLGIAIAIDKTGNVYVTGVSEETGFLTYAYATIKYNNNGIQQWVQRYRGPGDVRNDVHGIALDDSANVYVTGGSQSSISGHDSSSTIKYNTNGVVQWVKRYPGVGNSICADGQGNSYITGGPYTIKFNANGISQWISRTDSLNIFGVKIKIDIQGNVYITGSTYGNNPDFLTVKYNSNGTVLWTAQYNGPGDYNDYCHDLAIDQSGNVYITGGSASSTTGQSFDYATIKYNSNGVRQWVKRYNGPVNQGDEAFGIVLDSLRNVYVTGVSIGNNGSDCTTIKYDTNGNLQDVLRYDDTVGDD